MAGGSARCSAMASVSGHRDVTSATAGAGVASLPCSGSSIASACCVPCCSWKARAERAIAACHAKAWPSVGADTSTRPCAALTCSERPTARHTARHEPMPPTAASATASSALTSAEPFAAAPMSEPAAAGAAAGCRASRPRSRLRSRLRSSAASSTTASRKSSRNEHRVARSSGTRPSGVRKRPSRPPRSTAHTESPLSHSGPSRSDGRSAPSDGRVAASAPS
mmetsp:Transcript_80801/g.195994  ORF Transcript_80801/g.195994 Transcript_80801/m.195994 type:complete len:223 (+) Transcript_80801:227-895(+)